MAERENIHTDLIKWIRDRSWHDWYTLKFDETVRELFDSAYLHLSCKNTKLGTVLSWILIGIYCNQQSWMCYTSLPDFRLTAATNSTWRTAGWGQPALCGREHLAATNAYSCGFYQQTAQAWNRGKRWPRQSHVGVKPWYMFELRSEASSAAGEKETQAHPYDGADAFHFQACVYIITFHWAQH